MTECLRGVEHKLTWGARPVTFVPYRLYLKKIYAWKGLEIIFLYKLLRMFIGKFIQHVLNGIVRTP
jgi:hypothetical protein